MTTILHKRGKGIPTADKFSGVGEILIDSETGIAYTLTDGGDVSAVGGDQVWAVSEPDEYGQRLSKFADQVADSDANGLPFYIRYPTDGHSNAGQSSLMQASWVYGDTIWGDKLKATNKVEATEVEAESVTANVLGSALNVTAGLVVHGIGIKSDEPAPKLGAGYAIGAGYNDSPINPDKFNFTVAFDGSVRSSKKIQALDFLDKDGKSIVSDVSNLMSANSLNQCYEEEWGIIGEGFELRTDGITTNRFWTHIFQDQYVVASSADPDSPVFRLTAVGGGSAHFNCAVQATDFLDADGNSIIGAGGGLPEGESQNILYHNGNEWVATDAVQINPSTSRSSLTINNGGITLNTSDGGDGGQFKYSQYNEVTISHPTYGAQLYMQGQAGDPSKLTVNEGYFVTVKATDYLDADGNSIVGGGGGGGIDFPEADEGYAFLATPDGWVKFDGNVGQTQWLYKRHSGAMCWEGKKGHDTLAYEKSITVGYENKAAGKYDILIGNNNYDMGAYPTGHNVLIGTNNQCVSADGAIAIGKDHFLTMGDEPSIGFAIGEGNTVEGSGIAIGRHVSARSGQVIIGEKQVSFADDLVEAFTALQSAVADEDTVQGLKSALTNALGGLIEKFEQKARVEPLQRMSAEEAEAAGQSARARLEEKANA